MIKEGHSRRILLTTSAALVVFSVVLWIVISQFFNVVDANMNPSLEKKFLLYLTVVIVLFLLLSLFTVSRMIYHFTKPVDELTLVARKLASGDYKARVSVSEFKDLGNLAISINQIARNGQETQIVRSMEKERLKTLIESIGSSLLMLGRGGTVNLMNGVFAQTFNASSPDAIGKSYKEIGLPLAAEKLIEDVFLSEQVHEQQIRIQQDNGPLDLNVYGAPVIGRHGNWLGIIVVFHDISKIIRLEEVRKDFVANVSHELRTPVTSIKGFAETLLDGALSDPEISRDFITIIEKESGRLHSLVSDLLELSGIEQHGFTLNLSQVDAAITIQEAAQLVSGKLAEKQMTVEIEEMGELVIEADSGRLMQVLVNLLINAITYSKQGTTVRISGKKDHDSIVISIADEGIGIEKEKLQRVFERFYRADLARSRESGGTGLGLAIVKHLLEAHHGSIWVESELGEGSVFFIKLPIHQHLTASE
ncbi:two-component system histidine kinase PnpS [Sporosarcina gallistercoris]|uniref:histidine kinase n=1 Tax=Sporosarcina gallistercoris TaxID=2762245 RepID=A0ABR8PIG0_9BACL|nr:ATP-binding protein [Sporosarcina gallistercoris]MBD7907948.1 PAS domain-containing protein [Sporosarcina gallistercoris]